MNAINQPPSSPSRGAYRIVDHTYDVVVVGAGGAGLRATFGMGAARPSMVAAPPPTTPRRLTLHSRMMSSLVLSDHQLAAEPRGRASATQAGP